MQVRAFLERYPPFDSLSEAGLDRLVDGVEIEFFPAGSEILREAGEPSGHMYVVRTGAVELLDEGVLIDLLGEGESFGHPSLLSGLSPAFEVRALEDTLCYLVDRDAAQSVLGTSPGLAFLTASLGRRAELAARPGGPVHLGSHLATIGSIVRRAPIDVEQDATVRLGADLMAREHVSSLLIRGGDGLAIVTDRDLRTRILAKGLGDDTPLGRIASSPVVTAPADTTADVALLLMLDHAVHHLPVTGTDGSVIGVVTVTDLMGLERTEAFALLRSIERAGDAGELALAFGGLAGVVGGLVAADMDPVLVGRAIGVTVDTTTRRAIELAIDDLGDPPCAWAWLALGSQARHEQALRTDQDHGLALDPIEGTGPEADRYFADVATRVTDALEAAGIARCRGGVMAEEPLWRKTEQEWASEFARWMRDPSPDGNVFTNIALDYRRVAGPLDVESAIDHVVREAPRHPRFVRRLAQAAVERRPPTGFFRDLVVEAAGDHAGTLDLKAGGVIPLTNLARAYGAASGLSGGGTLARLRGAVSAGRLDARTGDDLAEAFRLIWRVRLEHQLARVQAGDPADDHVDPARLGTIRRGGLKDAFRLIALAQRELAREFGLMRS